MSKSNEMQSIIDQAKHAVRVRETTTGGLANVFYPYPLTAEEIAEELFQFLGKLEDTYVPGIIDELYELLFYHIRGRDIK